MDTAVRQAVAAADHVEGQGWVEAARAVASEGFKVVDGVVVDAFTASMLVQVHDALSAKNQAKFAAMDVAQAAEFGWALVERSKR